LKLKFTIICISRCSSVLGEFQSLFGEERPSAVVLAKQTTAYSNGLQSAVVEAQNELKRAAERAEIESSTAEEAVKSMEDAKLRLADIAKNDKRGSIAVDVVLCSTLYQLNEHILKMESVAKSRLFFC